MDLAVLRILFERPPQHVQGRLKPVEQVQRAAEIQARIRQQGIEQAGAVKGLFGASIVAQLAPPQAFLKEQLDVIGVIHAFRPAGCHRFARLPQLRSSLARQGELVVEARLDGSSPWLPRDKIADIRARKRVQGTETVDGTDAHLAFLIK